MTTDLWVNLSIYGRGVEHLERFLFSHVHFLKNIPYYISFLAEQCVHD
jgi:hypothetical protein